MKFFDTNISQIYFSFYLFYFKLAIWVTHVTQKEKYIKIRSCISKQLNLYSSKLVIQPITLVLKVVQFKVVEDILLQARVLGYYNPFRKCRRIVLVDKGDLFPYTALSKKILSTILRCTTKLLSSLNLLICFKLLLIQLLILIIIN